jgi:hypothetical protein
MMWMLITGVQMDTWTLSLRRHEYLVKRLMSRLNSWASFHLVCIICTFVVFNGNSPISHATLGCVHAEAPV